jgi:succinylglutamic semialdehyde dehydrogenase
MTDYCLLLLTDYCLPITAYRLLLTDYCLPITAYRLLLTDYWLTPGFCPLDGSVMRDHFIDGDWIGGRGEPFSSINPATGQELFYTSHASATEVIAAFLAAGKAFRLWADTDFDERIRIARRFGDVVQTRRQAVGRAISQETGKPLWETSQEVDTVVRKVNLSVEAYQKRTGSKSEKSGSGFSTLSHAPHGIVAVLGPFNFPAHLPNGHIIPALIAGNCVLFKPSELTPMAGAVLVDCWREAGLPAGCLNLLQGDRRTAELMLDQPGLAGVFFTGSAQTGIAIHQRFAGRPEVILALEMGGNNPLVVLKDINLAVAARIIAASAFISAGQRCTCTRRVILVDPAVLPELVQITEQIAVGAPDDVPEPFIGPVITQPAAQRVLQAQRQLIERGAKVLVECRPAKRGLPFLRPGIIDVTGISNLPDQEIFGPILTVTEARDFEEAIALANQTRFGLAAGLIGGNESDFSLFRRKVRAGVINWNRPTTGASSAAPFGGVGLSGNHRPSAFYAADYCAYPVATMQDAELVAPRYPGL